jgi:hypothetical protein
MQTPSVELCESPDYESLGTACRLSESYVEVSYRCLGCGFELSEEACA